MADTGNEINVLHDWDFSVNLSGLQAPTGKGGNALPTGYYMAELADLYVNPGRNINRVIIKCKVSDGQFIGVVRTTGFNKPTSDDDKVRYYWRGLAESVGYGATELDAGEVNLGRGTFLGKTAHVFFTAKEDSENGYENIDFLPPLSWSQRKQNFELTGGVEKAVETKAAKGSALGGGTTEIKKAKGLGGGDGDSKGGNSLVGGEGATSKSKLLSQLGMN
jgi:hypothetical protein